MWVLSFHGGSGGVNNLVGYDHHWSTTSDVTPVDPSIQELRGFGRVGTVLYVLQAHKSTSRVLKYGLTSGAYTLQGALAVQQPDPDFPSAPVVPGLVHPFDLAFGGDGTCYVSNQDTNAVLALSTDGTPLPVASSLGSGSFLAGTVVASAIGQLPLSPASVPTPPLVSGPGALGLLVPVAPTSGAGVSNSVRDVLVSGTTLFVADEVSDAVKAYSLPSGSLIATIAGKGLQAPVHLVASGATLYIGSSGNGSICTAPLASVAPLAVPAAGKPAEIAPTLFADGTAPAVSGLAIGKDGNVYAALRKSKEVVMFAAGQQPKTPPGVKVKDLPDEPEFLQHWA